MLKLLLLTTISTSFCAMHGAFTTPHKETSAEPRQGSTHSPVTHKKTKTYLDLFKKIEALEAGVLTLEQNFNGALPEKPQGIKPAADFKGKQITPSIQADLIASANGLKTYTNRLLERPDDTRFTPARNNRGVSERNAQISSPSPEKPHTLTHADSGKSPTAEPTNNYLNSFYQNCRERMAPVTQSVFTPQALISLLTTVFLVLLIASTFVSFSPDPAFQGLTGPHALLTPQQVFAPQPQRPIFDSLLPIRNTSTSFCPPTTKTYP